MRYRDRCKACAHAHTVELGDPSMSNRHAEKPIDVNVAEWRASRLRGGAIAVELNWKT